MRSLIQLREVALAAKPPAPVQVAPGDPMNVPGVGRGRIVSTIAGSAWFHLDTQGNDPTQYAGSWYSGAVWIKDLKWLNGAWTTDPEKLGAAGDGPGAERFWGSVAPGVSESKIYDVEDASEPIVLLDAAEVYPGLWQGGRPPVGSMLRDRGFDAVVLCAKNFQPSSTGYPGIEVLRCPLPDNSKPLKESKVVMVEDMAEKVAKRVRNGKVVLTTCWSGWNRSGLVNAFAMSKLIGESPIQSASRIQARRVGSLRNPRFLELLGRFEYGSRNRGLIDSFETLRILAK